MFDAWTDGRVRMHQPMYPNYMQPHVDGCSTGTWNTLPTWNTLSLLFSGGMSQETSWFHLLLVPILVIVCPFIFLHPSLGSCLPQEMDMGAQSRGKGTSAQLFTSNFRSPECFGNCYSPVEMLRRKQELCEPGLFYSVASAPDQRGFP